MSFPREKHQSIRVVAMSAVFSVSVPHGRGWMDALCAATAADVDRAPPLFATNPPESARKIDRGAHLYFLS